MTEDRKVRQEGPRPAASFFYVSKAPTSSTYRPLPAQADAANDAALESDPRTGASPPIFNTAEFKMYSFKVLPCVKMYCHAWALCPFAHPGEKARRRDVRVYQYAGIACPDMKKNYYCPRGDLCSYAHNDFEFWLHPERYRTQLCKDGLGCKRKMCFFAHRPEELRTASSSSGVQSASVPTLPAGCPEQLPAPGPQQLITDSPSSSVSPTQPGGTQDSGAGGASEQQQEDKGRTSAKPATPVAQAKGVWERALQLLPAAATAAAAVATSMGAAAGAVASSGAASGLGRLAAGTDGAAAGAAGAAAPAVAEASRQQPRVGKQLGGAVSRGGSATSTRGGLVEQLGELEVRAGEGAPAAVAPVVRPAESKKKGKGGLESPGFLGYQQRRQVLQEGMTTGAVTCLTGLDDFKVLVHPDNAVLWEQLQQQQQQPPPAPRQPQPLRPARPMLAAANWQLVQEQPHPQPQQLLQNLAQQQPVPQQTQLLGQVGVQPQLQGSVGGLQPWQQQQQPAALVAIKPGAAVVYGLPGMEEPQSLLVKLGGDPSAVVLVGDAGGGGNGFVALPSNSFTMGPARPGLPMQPQAAAAHDAGQVQQVYAASFTQQQQQQTLHMQQVITQDMSQQQQAPALHGNTAPPGYQLVQAQQQYVVQAPQQCLVQQQYVVSSQQPVMQMQQQTFLYPTGSQSASIEPSYMGADGSMLAYFGPALLGDQAAQGYVGA